MANEQMITIRGRLTGPPELRFTPSGAAVANFTIAANARTFDKQTNEWKDKETVFWRCSAWRELAENVAESLDKGMAVIAFAELEARSYEKDGQTRTVTEAKIEAIGPDLRWVSAKVTKVQRSQGQPQVFGQGGQQYGQGFGGQPQPGPGNPNAQGWGGGQQSNGGWGNPGADEPPF